MFKVFLKTLFFIGFFLLVLVVIYSENAIIRAISLSAAAAVARFAPAAASTSSFFVGPDDCMVCTSYGQSGSAQTLQIKEHVNFMFHAKRK